MPQKAFRSFANRAIKVPMKARLYRLMYDLTNAYDYQETFLLDTVYDSATAEYSKQYDFHEVESIKDYQKHVPLSAYHTLEPYIDRMLKGEENILTTNQVKRFAKSAGTTGSSSKYIPVTKESLQNNHFKASKDFMSMYLRNNPNSHLLKGLGMILSGSVMQNPYTKQNNVGFISGILTKEKPRRGGYFTALDQSYTQISDRKEKMDKVIKDFHSQNITSISGVGPRIVMLANKLQKYCNKPINEIRPDFELILSGGVNINLYIDQYRELFGNDVHIYNMYNASEGFYGFQIANNDHTLLLATNHAIFYEFIPMDKYNGTKSEAITLQEVKTGVDYALVITNNAGLRRYITGDTIRFTSLNPFKLEVTGRTKYSLNVFGEQVFQDHIVKTIKEVSDELGCCIKEYTVGPQYHQNRDGGYHERIIERTKEPENKEYFEERVDEVLQQNSHYYQDKRKDDILMTKPKFHHASEGLFYQWFEQNGRLGGQSKVPNLRNDRKYVDKLLKVIKR